MIDVIEIKEKLNNLTRKQLIDLHLYFINQFSEFEFPSNFYETKTDEQLKKEINYWLECIEKRLNNGRSF